MSETTNVQKKEQRPHVTTLEVIRNTAPLAVGELDFVRDKFISNYNQTHKQQIGELVYHRQLVHFKQIIGGSDKLKSVDTFSLYACFLTAAVNGDSFDPNDDETYLIPIGGKAFLWPQTKALVKRLRNSGQVNHADQARLVYQGDEFEVENGRVKKHVEKFTTEIIVAGYVRFVIDEKGTEKFFIYRKSDWEAWKAKSMDKNGANWSGNNGQPGAAFLRTKIIKHACKDKSWASGRFNPQVDQFNVEVDDPKEVLTENATATDVTTGDGQEKSFSPQVEEVAEVTVVHESNEDTTGF